jgi:hypothetical protein
MKWIDPKKQKPPQGKKILYFKSGDIYVVQRFGDIWAPIPFMDSRYAKLDEPDLWCDIIPPKGFTGKLYLADPDCSYKLDVDEFQTLYPEEHKEFVERIEKSIGKPIPS